MDEIQYFTFSLPGLDEQYNDKIKGVSDSINKRKAAIPSWIQGLATTPIRQLAVGSSHVAVLFEDGRLCRIGYSLNADQLESNKLDGKGGWSAKKPKKKSARLVSGIATGAERVPFRRNVTSAIAGLTGSSVAGGASRTGRDGGGAGGAATGRPSYSRLFMGSVPFIPPSQVPEDLIVQVQNVLQGKSRSLIIRELQRTNLDVNSAVNNLLSRDDDDGDEDEGGDLFADDLMSFVENNLTERGGSYIIDSDQMLVEDYINYAAAYRSGGSGSRQRLRGAVESLRPPGSATADPDNREPDFGRRWLESRLRDPLTSQISATSVTGSAPSVTSGGAGSIAGSLPGDNQTWEAGVSSISNISAAPDAITWDEPEWCVLLPDTVCSPPPKFIQIAAMHSELVALSKTGQVFQWKWNVSMPFTHPDFSNVHHPRVVHLGLQNEVVVCVETSALRCTVLTDNGQVATWMDPAVASYCNKLEHHAFSLDQSTSTSASDPSAISPNSFSSIFVCDLFTVASTHNQHLYWWGVAPFSQRRKLLEKMATKNSKSTAVSGSRSSQQSQQQQPIIAEGCTVTKKKSPMYHAGAIGFCDFTFPPKVGQLMEDIWNLDASCRFKILPLEKKRDDSTKTEMLPPPSPVSVGSEGSHKSGSRKRRKSVSPHPFANEEDVEEIWNPKHVVFLEDSQNIPVGTVLKVDGNIAAVKFPSDKNCSSAATGISSIDDDQQNFLKECRLFQKSDLQALRPNSLPRFMDCIQRIPKKIQMSDKYHTIAFSVDNRGVHVLSSCAQSRMYYILIEPSTGRVEERRVFSSDPQAFLGRGQPVMLRIASEEPAKLLMDGNGALYPICKDDAGQMREPIALNLLPIKTAAIGTHYLREGISATQRVMLTMFITKHCPTMSAILQCDRIALDRQLASFVANPDVEGPSIVAERSDGNRNIIHALVYLARPTSNDNANSTSTSVPTSSRLQETATPMNTPSNRPGGPLSSDALSSAAERVLAQFDHVGASGGTFNDTLRRVQEAALSAAARQANFDAVPTLTWPPDPPAYQNIQLSDASAPPITDPRLASQNRLPVTTVTEPTTGSSASSGGLYTSTDTVPPSTDVERQKTAVQMLTTIFAGATKQVVPQTTPESVTDSNLSGASTAWKPHLISLLSLRDGRGMTPFMLAVNLRAYQMGILIFNASKQLAVDENGVVDKEVLMQMVFPPCNKDPDLSPLYMLCCNDNCSFTWTGDLHINQDIFECKTCGLHDTFCCCTECARTCHQGHDCKLKKTWPTAYCDCWRRGRCCALIEGDQTSRYSLLCQLLEHTDLAAMRNKRGEHLLLFLVNTMSRQILEQSGLSKSSGVSTASGSAAKASNAAAGSSSRNENDSVEGMPDHNLEPPKFCRRALLQVVQNWRAVSSMMQTANPVQQCPDLPDLDPFQLSYLKSQSGSSKLDAFTYKLIVKCKTENIHLDKLLDTLGSRLTGPLKTPESVSVVRRFVRSVCRVYVILSMETSHSKNKANIASEPLRRCKKVFRSLLSVSIEELSETADALVAPVRMGIARPTRPFSSILSADEKQGSAELFSTEPLPPRRSVGFEEAVASASSAPPALVSSRPIIVEDMEPSVSGGVNDGTLGDDEIPYESGESGVDTGAGVTDDYADDDLVEDDMDDGPGSSAEGGLGEDDVQFDVDMMEESDSDSDRSEAHSPALDTTNATIGSDIFMGGNAMTSNINMGILSDGEESHSSQDDESEGSPTVIEDLFPPADSALDHDPMSAIAGGNRNVPQSIQWAVGGQPAAPVTPASRGASSFVTSSPMSAGAGSNMIYVDPNSLRRSTITSAAAAAVASSSLAAAAAASMAEPCSSAATNVSLTRAFSVLMRTLAELVLLASDGDTESGFIPHTHYLNLQDYVDRRLGLTWDWLSSVMDSIEAQLRFGSALITNTDLTHPTHPLHPSQRRSGNPSSAAPPAVESSVLAHPRRTFDSSVRNPGRAAQQDSSAARRDFLNYLLSLMRSHSSEHSDALPVIDISAFKHVAYVLDAMVYYLKNGKEAANKSYEVDEIVDYGDFSTATNTSTADDDYDNEYDSLDESYNNAGSIATDTSGASKRGFSFFRRSTSTLCLGASPPSPFETPLHEALPLAEKPTLLTPHATKEELFGRAKLIIGYEETSADMERTVTLDRADIELVPLSLALTDRLESSLETTSFTTTSSRAINVTSSLHRTSDMNLTAGEAGALDMSSSTLNAAAAAADPVTFLMDEDVPMSPEIGVPTSGQPEASATSTPTRDETPAGAAPPAAIRPSVTSSTKQNAPTDNTTVSTRSTHRLGKVHESVFTRDMLLGRWSHSLELFGRVFMEDVGAQPGSLLSEISSFDVREARFKKEMEKIRNSQTRDLTLDVERDRHSLITWTMKQLNSQYSKRSTFPGQPMAVHKVKVTFTNEPGEGTGVSRSFFTAIADALLADEKLPPNLPSTLSINGELTGSNSLIRRLGRIPIRKMRGSTTHTPVTPGGSSGRHSPTSSLKQSPKTSSASAATPTGSTTNITGLNVNATPYAPPQDDTQHNSLGAMLYANALSLHPVHAAKITGMLLELDCQQLVQIKSNSDKFREKVDQALNLILNPNSQPTVILGESVAPDEDQCAPLFYQPGKLGQYSPRLGKCTRERLEVFRNVGRLIGLCLLQNELIPIPLNRHVLKYILNREISWHDFAFFDPVMYESMRKLIVDASSDDAAEMFRDLGLTYSVVLRTEEGGGEVSLVPLGADIQVTPDNVVDFVRRYCEYRMKVALEKPLKAMRRGVYEVIPPSALSDLTAEDLRLLLNGTVTIDPKQLLGFTTFNDESGEDNQERIKKFKKNFWAIVEKMSQKELQDLLSVPASEEGFQPMPSITMRPADDNYFPTANTCISRLYIPLYSSKAHLKTKVLQAIQVKSFGFV